MILNLPQIYKELKMIVLNFFFFIKKLLFYLILNLDILYSQVDIGPYTCPEMVEKK